VEEVVVVGVRRRAELLVVVDDEVELARVALVDEPVVVRDRRA
jgi:hypothetical protein